MVLKAFDVGGYIAALPENARHCAELLRCTIRAELPDAFESIRYGMPAYGHGRRTVIYFAVWKFHAALYPIYQGSPDFERQIAPYRDKKDTLRFPLDRPLPLDLVTLVVRNQLACHEAKQRRA